MRTGVKQITLFLCILSVLNTASAQAYKTASPDSIEIITTDINNFWQTYDRLAKAQTLSDSIETIQEYYLDKASYGLQQYIKASNSTPMEFCRAIRMHKNYLSSIRSTTASIPNYKIQITTAAKRLKSIYPVATFPQVYFVMGKFEVGGTQFPNFLYIGAELMCASSASPLQEIKADLRPTISTIRNIATICIHEMIHYQQQYQDAKNILEGTLIEGGADFITKKITGHTTAQSCFAYGYKHEKVLWTEFKNEDTSQNFAKWFVNIPDTIAKRPAMLGYFIGYRICEQYYLHSKDKAIALRDIVTLKDPLAIYHKSKYAEN